MVASLLTAVSMGAAFAGDVTDPWFIKTPNDPGVDSMLGEEGDEPAKPEAVTPAGPAVPLQPTLSDLLRELCTATTANAIIDPQGLPICVTLQRQDAEDALDAASVARTLRDRLDLPRPQMRTSPQAPVKALVGLETWLWVEPAQWEPVELSSSLGGITVTVTARPVQSLWDMGEGTKACSGPGRVWRAGLGQDATTPCGFTYSSTSLREPEGRFEVAATLRYSITWTCSGGCAASTGDLGTLDSLADTADLEVGERQSVVIR